MASDVRHLTSDEILEVLPTEENPCWVRELSHLVRIHRNRLHLGHLESDRAIRLDERHGESTEGGIHMHVAPCERLPMLLAHERANFLHGINGSHRRGAHRRDDKELSKS